MHKILVVDDNEYIRELYQEVLTKEGYAVMTACSGKEALKIFDEEKLDLVTLDIKMPGENGLEILSVMKSKNKNIPVIISTAYGNYKQDYISWASDAFLVKSTDLEELKQKVKELLEKKGE